MKKFFLELPYFLKYLIKEPYREVKGLVNLFFDVFKGVYSTLKGSGDFFHIIRTPKSIVYLLALIIIVELFFGEITGTPIYSGSATKLFFLLVLAVIFKIYREGRWRYEMKKDKLKKLKKSFSYPPKD